MTPPTLSRRAALAAPFLNLRAKNRGDRPNILWLLGDDLGPQLGCYGHKLVTTPNADKLAAEGARFTHCFTTAPVCSPARSAWNTGVYQTTIGAHNHRSHRKDGYKLPAGVQLVSHRLKEAGYFTANVTDMGEGLRASGKTDFNFSAGRPFDGTHWNQRAKGQPFYAQINFIAPHKGPVWPQARKNPKLVDPASVELPPYYPDHPVVRDEVANYLDAVNFWDLQVGQVVERLKADGLYENTVIFVFGDNGRCLIRGKQWLYDPGTQIPLIVRWPDRVKAGLVRRDPVLSLDITATTLDAAGVAHPPLFHGQSLFAKANPRTEIFTARDRCDMTVDRIRAVRDGRYKLIHNFYPDRSYAQYNQYIKTSYPTLSVLQDLGKQGKLNDVQARWVAPSRPEFELYDHQADPHEVVNLTSNPRHKKAFDRLRGRLDKWIVDTNDQGRTPESREVIELEEPRAREAQ
ncbi:MAG: sulfatase [Acidobacteria bacterium]|nr:sulfatase [Acidobacteriota bacterium]